MTENDKKRVEEEKKELSWETNHKIKIGEACPHCLSESILKEGRCLTCLNCGWSRCDL